MAQSNNHEESKQYESEQEDDSVSIEPKKKVQLGIMSFYKKKQKKRGRGRPRKVPPPPLQPAKKQKVDEPKAGHRIKHHNYSDPAVAAARLESVEFYISTGGKFPTQPIINIPKRVIKRDAEKLSHINKQTNNNAPPFRLNSGGGCSGHGISQQEYHE
jgi:hypothetical protein